MTVRGFSMLIIRHEVGTKEAAYTLYSHSTRSGEAIVAGSVSFLFDDISAGFTADLVSKLERARGEDGISMLEAGVVGLIAAIFG